MGKRHEIAELLLAESERAIAGAIFNLNAIQSVDPDLATAIGINDLVHSLHALLNNYDNYADEYKVDFRELLKEQRYVVINAQSEQEDKNE